MEINRLRRPTERSNTMKITKLTKNRLVFVSFVNFVAGSRHMNYLLIGLPSASKT